MKKAEIYRWEKFVIHIENIWGEKILEKIVEEYLKHKHEKSI